MTSGGKSVVKSNLPRLGVRHLDSQHVARTEPGQKVSCFGSNIRVTSQEIENITNQLNPPYILMGDLNASSELWGSANSNPRGNMLRRVFEDLDLVVLNDGSTTHYSTAYHTSSALDVSVCSADLAPFTSWTVSDDFHGSDHAPVILELALRNADTKHPTWVTDRADWEKFKELAVFRAEEIPDDPNEGLQFIRNKIIHGSPGICP